MVTLAEGMLLMNGTTVVWPPLDIFGRPIEIGAQVYGLRDTFNLQDEHRFYVGGLRLQNDKGYLAWVVCAYDDDERYFECFARDCTVLRAAPRPEMQYAIYRGDAHGYAGTDEGDHEVHQEPHEAVRGQVPQRTRGGHD